MQEIKIYVSAAESVGVIRDYANAKNANAPALVRGVETLLKLRLFSEPDSMTPYPIEQLADVMSWQFVMDADFDSQTAYKIVADNENITVNSVTVDIDGTNNTFTEIGIPLTNTNTAELDSWLNTAKSKAGLTAELVGYDSNGTAIFVLQLENFTIRNRLTSVGEPTNIADEWLNAAQVRALIIGDFRNPLEYQFSSDGENDWHENQTANDLYLRQRIANLDAEWSSAIMLTTGGGNAPGPQGEKGDPGPQGEKGEKGEKGDPGQNGTNGYTPQRGVDYWTDADKMEIRDYCREMIENEILNGEW